MSDIAVIDHAIKPQYVPVNKRYQCRMCHSWIHYDEGDGRWHHTGES
jgi:hypothetical protein